MVANSTGSRAEPIKFKLILDAHTLVASPLPLSAEADIKTYPIDEIISIATDGKYKGGPLARERLGPYLAIELPDFVNFLVGVIRIKDQFWLLQAGYQFGFLRRPDATHPVIYRIYCPTSTTAALAKRHITRVLTDWARNAALCQLLPDSPWAVDAETLCFVALVEFKANNPEDIAVAQREIYIKLVAADMNVQSHALCGICGWSSSDLAPIPSDLTEPIPRHQYGSDGCIVMDALNAMHAPIGLEYVIQGNKITEVISVPPAVDANTDARLSRLERQGNEQTRQILDAISTIGVNFREEIRRSLTPSASPSGLMSHLQLGSESNSPNSSNTPLPGAPGRGRGVGRSAHQSRAPSRNSSSTRLNIATTSAPSTSAAPAAPSTAGKKPRKNKDKVDTKQG